MLSVQHKEYFFGVMALLTLLVALPCYAKVDESFRDLISEINGGSVAIDNFSRTANEELGLKRDLNKVKRWASHSIDLERATEALSDSAKELTTEKQELIERLANSQNIPTVSFPQPQEN